MNCEVCRQGMMDVLYGEDVDARSNFNFFRHLDQCPSCSQEYLHLLETREVLSQWRVEEEPVAGDHKPWRNRPSLPWSWSVSWWGLVTKVAATLLLILGGLSLLDRLGYWRPSHRMVSQQELVLMVHDMVVSAQEEERKLIGMALLQLREDVEIQQRYDRQQFSEYLTTLERRYVENLEQSNRYLEVLLSR